MISKLRICSDASAVSGKTGEPAAWCAVLEWTQPHCPECLSPNGNFSMAVAGVSSTSKFGVLGAELAGVISGLIAARLITKSENRKETSLDLYVDNSQIDSAARGVTPRPAPGKGTAKGIRGMMWKEFDALASEFGDVSIQWRPRNTLLALHMADKVAGRCRLGELKIGEDLSPPSSGSVYLLDSSVVVEGARGGIVGHEAIHTNIHKARVVRDLEGQEAKS